MPTKKELEKCLRKIEKDCKAQEIRYKKDPSEFNSGLDIQAKVVLDIIRSLYGF